MYTKCQFNIGDIVEVADKLDPENLSSTIATVKYIELDDEIPNLYWLYLIANEEILNVHTHIAFGYYWEIIPSHSPYIRLISNATMN